MKRKETAQRDLTAWNAPTKADQYLNLLTRIASRPLSTEDTHATWTPPEWEDVIEWYDDAVKAARELTGKKYR